MYINLLTVSMRKSTSFLRFFYFITNYIGALVEILEAFKQPENVSKMQEARENTGNNMLKMMQFVFPLATQVQMNIITKYGFTADGPGIAIKL